MFKKLKSETNLNSWKTFRKSIENLSILSRFSVDFDIDHKYSVMCNGFENY